MRRYGAWVAILLSTLYLVFFGGGWLGIYTSWTRALTVLLAAAVLWTWGIVALRNPVWRPHSRLLPAICAILAVFAISTAFSRHPRQSLEYFGYAWLLAGLYLLLVRILADRFFRPRIEMLSVGLALVLGGAYTVANVVRWADWWGVVGHLTLPPLRPDFEGLTYGNPSAAMTIVLLFACSALPVLLRGGRGPHIIAGAIGFLALFSIFVSGSRAGWLAVGIAIVPTAVLYGIAPPRRRWLRASVARITATLPSRLALLAAGGCALGVTAVLAPVIVRRFTDTGAEARLSYVMSAQRMFAESPIVGLGPGSWAIERMTYTVTPEANLHVPHAHNIYAQAAAEFGVLGLLAGLVLLVGLVILLRDGASDVDPVRRRWAWAATFAMAYFAAHQLLDVYSNMTAVLFAAAIPIAWLDATSARMAPTAPQAERWGPSARRAATAAGLAVLGVSSLGLTITEIPVTIAAQAVEHLNGGEWASADAEAQVALGLDPGWEPYRFTMALAAAHVGDHERAAAAFRAVAEKTDLPEAWVNLAAEELALGNQASARDAIVRATRLGLQRPALDMAIGDLASRLGDVDLSDAAFVEALVHYPSLAADPWWQADSARAARLPQLVEAAIVAAPPPDRWQLALMAGDPDRARSLLSADPDVETTVPPLDVIAAWSGDAAAFERIIAICDANPLDVVAVTWAARLEGRLGNTDAANRYRRWGFTVSGGAGVSGSEVRVADGHLLGRAVRGGVAEFWGTYGYRRITPWNPLVPSVVQLTLE